GAIPGRIVGPHIDRAVLSRPVVEPAQITIVVAAINDIRVQRIGNDIARFETRGGFPVALSDGRPWSPAFDAHARIVLLRAQDMIGESVVRRYAVDLCRWLIVQRAPVLTAIEADLRTAVIGQDDAAAVVRIYPEIVMIAMRRTHLGEGLAAVQAAHEFDIGTVDRILVRGVDVYPVKIPGALFDILLAID